jgi:hypothetical protein
MKRGRNRAIINRDVPLDDVVWEEMRELLSRLYLQEWAVIEAEYKRNEDINDVVSVVCDVSDVITRIQKNKNIYVARIWELWKPILTLGKQILFSSDNPQGNYTNNTNNTNNTKPTTLTLFEQLLEISVDLILEKETENSTETGESWLLVGMLKLVSADKYYKPSELLAASGEFVEFLPQWFNTKWIGRALKRLGFKDKRRCGRGVEYRLTPETVQDMADRLDVTLPPTEEEQTKTAEEEAKKKAEKEAEAAKKAEEKAVVVPANPLTIGENEIEYKQLCCVFCQEPILDLAWVKNGFTWDKPAHQVCYDRQKAGLKDSEQEFTDENLQGMEAS